MEGRKVVHSPSKIVSIKKESLPKLKCNCLPLSSWKKWLNWNSKIPFCLDVKSSLPAPSVNSVWNKSFEWNKKSIKCKQGSKKSETAHDDKIKIPQR